MFACDHVICMSEVTSS